MLKMAHAIVSFTMKNGGSFHSCVNVCKRLTEGKVVKQCHLPAMTGNGLYPDKIGDLRDGL